MLGRPPPPGPAESARDRPGTGSAHPWDEQVPPPGQDATLLAVVPIPGTGTSLAIVGYVVGTSAASPAVPSASHPATSPGHPAMLRTQHPSGSGLRLDHVQRRVWADGQEIQLTFQEFELLAFLSAHPATVFSRADLVQRVWQRRFEADSRTVDVHVSRLRHKLGPVYGRCLVTEYRVGYMFRPPVG